MRPIAPLLPVLLGTIGGCTVKDPLYCDQDRRCEDPERPFCDLDGVHPVSEGIKRTCIPQPEVEEQPVVDFALSVSDEEMEVHVGGELEVVLTVVRAKGFTGDIVVRADGLPDGLSASPVTVGGRQDAVTLTIRADDAEPGSSSDVTLIGAAEGVERTSKVNLAVLGASGTLDASFGILGFATETGGRTDDVEFVSGLPGGRVLVGGNPVVNASVTVMTQRFTATGGLDESYGEQGSAGFDLFGINSQSPLALTLQNPGKIVFASAESPGDIALGRADTDGHFDPTFAGSGSVVLRTPNPVQAAAIAIGPQQEIVVGMLETQPDDRLLLARFSADGIHDQAFAKGLVPIDLGDRHRLFELTVLSDGSVAGLVNATNADEVEVTYLFRITRQGSLDEGFDDDGVLQWEDAANPGALRGGEDGRILVAGSRAMRPTLWRLEADGTFDPSFGEAGERQLLPEGRTGGMNEFFEASDGKLMTVGSPGVTLIRLNEALDGVDASFGDGGMSRIELPPPLNLRAAASVGRGRIVALADNDSFDFALARIFE